MPANLRERLDRLRYGPLPQFTRQGKAECRLTWRQDWGSYPSSDLDLDLDLFLIRPHNTVVLNGATLSSPESASITSPEAGVWTAIVFGFEINTADDKYELRIALDGNVQ